MRASGDGAEHEAGLLDTSIFIAKETGRPSRVLPRRGAVSVVTVAELYLGVLMADDQRVRAQRLLTLSDLQEQFTPLPIDANVARRFAEIVAESRRQGRRPKVMDTWIAATAATADLPVYTQDDGFLAIPLVRVVRI